ncbi:prokineticin-1 [Leucoraja erinacea]|uniref:prokineticin-1 n=1 Tax=Leucoraja erinaceus TaxID=7782 RepID=UPI002456BC41|nr:prokineticin-1 [Leucoraja erinacea]
MKILLLLTFLLVLSCSHSIVITGPCLRDMHCGSASCCAVSLWMRGLRMCSPQGGAGDPCHPHSHKVPFWGKRQHHTCPCLPHLSCGRFPDSSFRCTPHLKQLQ